MTYEVCFLIEPWVEMGIRAKIEPVRAIEVERPCVRLTSANVGLLK